MTKKKILIIAGIIIFLLITGYFIYYMYNKKKNISASNPSGGGDGTGPQILLPPIEGPLTSPFGPRTAPVTGASTFHNGIDIGATLNAPIHAPMDGVVEGIYNAGMGGKQMVIKHGDWKTGYADLNGYAEGLKQGDTVTQGQVIAYAGQSGPSTGVHLHFTLTNPAGLKVDPINYLNQPLPAA